MLLIKRYLPSSRILRSQSIWIVGFCFFVTFFFVLRPTIFRDPIELPKLLNQTRINVYPSIYENIVLLSCSSYSYSLIYCYYLPYVALAWRRLGFEPYVLLVGSADMFENLPLMNLLRNDLRIRYEFISSTRSESISISQLVRLFGGFISFPRRTERELFIILADVDLLPITKHRFDLQNNETNRILIVNAYCCHGLRFSYQKYHRMNYYPISYVGMTSYLWKDLFLPLNHCDTSTNLTVDFIRCSLKEIFNQTIPENVIKTSDQWDIDQKLLSYLIARAEDLRATRIEKRQLGYRLDPSERYFRTEFDDLFFYDDVHLLKHDEEFLFRNTTWKVLEKAMSKLFNSYTMKILSVYHHHMTNIIMTSRKRNRTSQMASLSSFSSSSSLLSPFNLP